MLSSVLKLRPLAVLSAWWIMVVALVGSVLMNMGQLAARTVMYPVLGYRRGLAWAQSLANTWWDLFLFTVELWGDIPLRFHGDALRRDRKNAILSGNHESGMDFIIGVAASSRAGLGCGRMMTMMKQSLMFFPIVGWTNRLQGSLFLKRQWEKDHKALVRKLNHMEDGMFPRPFWIGIYPEGTRMTKAKYERSVEFAKSRGLPVLKNLLLPRTKGWVFLKKNLPTSVDHVYDVTTCYTGGAMFPLDFLFKGRFTTKRIDVHVKDHSFKSLPHSDEDLKTWMMDRFVEKDNLITEFKENGTFVGAPLRSYPNLDTTLFLYFLGWSLLVLALAFKTIASPTALSVMVVAEALVLSRAALNWLSRRSRVNDDVSGASSAAAADGDDDGLSAHSSAQIKNLKRRSRRAD